METNRTGTAHHGEIELVHETLGPAGGEPLLLVCGLGGQLTNWSEELCALLVARGFQGTRFDNRDAGLSTHLDGLPAPGVLHAFLRPGEAPYRLEDMADDAVCVMDALGWDSAHVVGVSLGGTIAQTLAITHPERVRSLTSIMSTPAAHLGTIPTPRVLWETRKAPKAPVTDAEKAADEATFFASVFGSPDYPADEGELRERVRGNFTRRPDDLRASARQQAALVASGDRRKALARLDLPTLVLHGDADRVIRPSAGRATARAVPGARLVLYRGMGHDLPRALWPSIVDEIATLTTRSPTGFSRGESS
jgi:pimeloyl-ACP methyl ester carboxylesterase